jgi:hypothetical protein
MGYKLNFRQMKSDLTDLGIQMKRRKEAASRIWIYWKYSVWRKETIKNYRERRGKAATRL